MKRIARSVALGISILVVAVFVTGCATQAQRQFQAIKSDNAKALADLTACATTVYNSPDNAPIRAHLPLNVADVSLQQLSDASLATPAEIQAIFAVHPQVRECRKALLTSLSESEPAVVPPLITSYNKADDDIVALTQRKLSWGEYVHRWRDRVAETREAIEAADHQVVAELKEEHQAEIAQRQRAAEALAQWARTQELINAANRPVVTNCSGFGNMVNCVSR